MKKEEVLKNFYKISNQEGSWKTVEVFSDQNGALYPAVLDTVVQKEDEICVFMFAVGGFSINIFMMPAENRKLEFAVSCGFENDWFSSNSLAECIDFAKEWFLEHK